MNAPAGANYLPALTGLRWVLALWVIFHHLTGPGQSLEPAALALPRPLYTLIRGGYLAVTTFFVLSGFVVARSHAMEHWSGRTLLQFAAGRVARVYPVYLVSMAVIAPFIAADHTPGKWLYVTEYLLLLQGWFGNTPVHWNTPAWTLTCEMFFYLAFPFLAAPIAKAGWRGTLAAAAVAIVSHARSVGRRRTRRTQTDHSSLRFPDGHRGLSRVRPASHGANRAARRVAIPSGGRAHRVVDRISTTAAAAGRSQHRAPSVERRAADRAGLWRRAGRRGRSPGARLYFSGKRAMPSTSCTCRCCGGTCGGRANSRRSCT